MVDMVNFTCEGTIIYIRNKGEGGNKVGNKDGGGDELRRRRVGDRH